MTDVEGEVNVMDFLYIPSTDYIEYRLPYTLEKILRRDNYLLNVISRRDSKLCFITDHRL